MLNLCQLWNFLDSEISRVDAWGRDMSAMTFFSRLNLGLLFYHFELSRQSLTLPLADVKIPDSCKYGDIIAHPMLLL
jgi:hypothetical protein